jgi:hypothetical protein
MSMNMLKEIAALRKMTMRELRQRYNELFDATSTCNNKQWLLKRIIWRLQANAEGDLSERAKRRAAELANDADLRLSPPKSKCAPPPVNSTPSVFVPTSLHDSMPPPGTVIFRLYKGQELRVMVLPDGHFEFEGERFRSLSALAKMITGTHVNGRKFFGIAKEVA